MPNEISNNTSTNEINVVSESPINLLSLHNIQDLKADSHANIGDAKVTNVAHAVLSYDPEAMIWQDSPSVALIIPSLIKWIFYLTLAYFLLQIFRPPSMDFVKNDFQIDKNILFKSENSVSSVDKKPNKLSQEAIENKPTKIINPGWFRWFYYAYIIILLEEIYSFINWILRIKNISYKMSSQRLKIESGIFSKTIETYELHKLDGGQVFKPWNLRLFGRENLCTNGVWLSGIRNAEVVRDLIRNAGQIEANRVEKARYR